MTHHFLRASARVPTPSEMLFHQQRQAARARIDQAAMALVQKAIDAKEKAAAEHKRREQERIAELNRLRDEARKAHEAEAAKVAHARAERVLENGLPIIVRERVDIIQKLACAAFHITRAEIKSPRRDRTVVMARQVAMYLCKTLTQQSLPAIGRRFGGRDHTTVLHAVRKAEAILAMPDGQGWGTWTPEQCAKIRQMIAYVQQQLEALLAKEEAGGSL